MIGESWRELAAVSGVVIGVSAAAFNVYGSMVLRARDREDFLQLRKSFEEYRVECASCPGRKLTGHMESRMEALSEQIANLRVAIARLERNGNGKS